MIAFFIIRPIVVSSWKIYQDDKNAKKELEDVSHKKAILEKLAGDENLATVYSIASKYYPEKQNTGDFVIELTAIANQSNLKVEQFSFDSGVSSPKSTTSDDTSTSTSTKSADSSTSASSSSSNSSGSSSPSGGGEIKFSMKLNGSFLDFTKFLKGAETSSRLFTITSLNITQGESNVSLQISGKTYWNKAELGEITAANLNLSSQTISKFLSLKTYGTPINLPTESGFGRVNPFESF